MRRAFCTVWVSAWLVSAAWAEPLDNLDKYIAKKDKSYQWRIIDEQKVTPTVSRIEMILTSQTWRGMDWHHRVQIFYPKKMANVHHAFMLISGGSWNDEREKQREERLRKERKAREAGEEPAEKPGRRGGFEGKMATQIVAASKMPMAVLGNVPLQPIFDGKSEDAIISYTFEKYLETGEPDWPLLLPMTKSAVRAMDALQALAKKRWQTELTGFVVAGGSKRGWTTWLTSAVDKRVKACAPAVIDVLNMSVQMKHQLAAWGKYSAMIEDYTMRGIQGQMDTPRGQELLRIVDPYSYRQRITMPKMLIIGTNDPYWPLDALNIYWDDLVGDKYILYVPNKGHGVDDFSRLIANCSAMCLLGSGQVEFPKMTWDLTASDKGLALKVKTDKEPKRMRAYITESPTRDFRKAEWRYEELTASDGVFAHKLPMPESGYAAMFGEGVFKLKGLVSVYLSTNVKIIGPGPKTPKTQPKTASE